MPRVIVFDVNETLLDLAALDVHFERIFGQAQVRATWFAQFIQCALVATVTNHYAPFGAIGMGALEMVAASRGVTLRDADKQAVREGLGHLPAHPEVKSALQTLRDSGLRLAALTNSTAAVAETQLTNAGLRDLFEGVFSADSVKRLKPAPEPYRYTAAQMGVSTDQIRLVAAHAWDIAGALRAGAAAAFVARPGIVLDPNVEKPDIVEANMTDIARKIIAVELATSH